MDREIIHKTLNDIGPDLKKLPVEDLYVIRQILSYLLKTTDRKIKENNEQDSFIWE